MTVRVLTDGDLFSDPSWCWVNPVNTVGVMGAGVAKQFATRFPRLLPAYRQACRDGRCSIGRVFMWANPDYDQNDPHSVGWIANLATKKHWRDPSLESYVSTGLISLAHELRQLGIVTVAMPALGAGLGGLPFPTVQQLVEDTFRGEGTEVRLYAPRQHRRP